MSSEYQAYLDILAQSHKIRTVCKIYDADENYLVTVTNKLVGGQVDIDTTAEVDRSASVVFADVTNKLLFDNTGEALAIYADRMLGIEYLVDVPSLNKEVVVPVFFGPITRFERDGAEVHVDAQGKESLLQDPVTWGRYLKNAGLDSISSDIKLAAELVKTILQSTGEPASNMHFGNFAGHKLPKGFKLPKAPENLWAVCQKIVQSVPGDQLWRLFYDAQGKVRVENIFEGGYTFKDGKQGVIANVPQVAYDLSTFRNTVVVHVNRQDGITRFISSSLPKPHPLSPHSLARNGVPRYLVENVDNDNIRSLAVAKSKADAYLKKLSTESVQVSFDCLPIPHLQPGAKCRLVHGEDRVEQTFFADQYSLPLRAGDLMSVGYTKRMQIGSTKPTHIHWLTKPPPKKKGAK